jgi:hypothetical protein
MPVALLAPVPEVHLLSGKEVCDKKGKVAFGSNDFELFLKLKQELPKGGCDVLVYASHSERATSAPTVTWRAVYLDFDDAQKPALQEFRPPSTITDKRWAIFWAVAELQCVPKADQIEISSLRGYGKPQRYLTKFKPERPIPIEAP